MRSHCQGIDPILSHLLSFSSTVKWQFNGQYAQRWIDNAESRLKDVEMIEILNEKKWNARTRTNVYNQVKKLKSLNEKCVCLRHWFGWIEVFGLIVVISKYDRTIAHTFCNVCFANGSPQLNRLSCYFSLFFSCKSYSICWAHRDISTHSAVCSDSFFDTHALNGINVKIAFAKPNHWFSVWISNIIK